MIFADKLIAHEPELTQTMMLDARKVRIHPDVYAAAHHLIEQGEEKIRKVAPFAVWPDHETWIEGRANDADGYAFDYGFLYYGGNGQNVKSVTAGYGMMVIWRPGDEDPISIPCYYDLANYTMVPKMPIAETKAAMAKLPLNDPLRREYEAFANPMTPDHMTVQMHMAPLLNAMKPLLFAFLALMNSPKIVRLREHDHAKLNARRIKKGKYPYYPHHEVVLNIDKHSFMVTRGQGDGPERSLHFVRSHLRFYVHPRYKNVEVTIVQPHWRGNPELGIRNTRYAMGRENSKWD